MSYLLQCVFKKKSIYFLKITNNYYMKLQSLIIQLANSLLPEKSPEHIFTVKCHILILLPCLHEQNNTSKSLYIPILRNKLNLSCNINNNSEYTLNFSVNIKFDQQILFLLFKNSFSPCLLVHFCFTLVLSKSWMLGCGAVLLQSDIKAPGKLLCQFIHYLKCGVQ